MIVRHKNHGRNHGLGAAVQYYTMPDAQTQQILANRGDTIQIVPDTRQEDAIRASGNLPSPPPPVAPRLAPAGPLDTQTIIANQNAANIYEEQTMLWMKAMNAGNDPASYAFYMNLVKQGVVPTDSNHVVVVPAAGAPTPLAQAQPAIPAESGNWLNSIIAAVTLQPNVSQTTGGYVTSVAITNNNGTNTSFKVGDSWVIQVTGTPDSTVKVVGGKNGGSASTVMGTTGADGKWSTSGTMSSNEVGNWTEEWFVNGVSAGKFSFTVGSGGSAVAQSTTEQTGGASPFEISVPSFFSEEIVPSVPNWMLIAGTAIGLFLLKGGK